MDVGDAETALVEILFFAEVFQNLGVDEGMLLGGRTVGLGFFVVGAESNDHKTNAEVNLRGGKTHAVGGIHGLVHVGNQLVEAGVVLVDWLRNLAQSGMAVANDGIKHLFKFYKVRIKFYKVRI